jgi:RsiW-degrading membrane proteinase PrsW (M82 family)
MFVKSFLGTIKYSLAVSIALILLTVISPFWFQRNCQWPKQSLKVVLCLLLGLGCLVCTILPTVFIFVFQSKLGKTIEHNLPSFFSMEDGSDGIISLGALSCAVVIITSGFATLVMKG